MRFEIPFNQSLHDQQMVLIFNDTWKSHLSRLKIQLLFVILSFSLVIYMFYAQSNLSYLVMAIGFFYLLNSINVYSSYLKSKKKFFIRQGEVANAVSEDNKTTVWEFTENHLYFKDALADGRLHWKTVQNMRIIEDTMVITVDYGIPSQFLIGRSEIGDEEFSKITSLVKQKIEEFSV